MWRYISKSTLKREAATLLMMWLCSMATYIIVHSEASIQVQVLGMFVLPVGVIFAGAFGTDWISKQTNIAGPPSASTQGEEPPK